MRRAGDEGGEPPRAISNYRAPSLLPASPPPAPHHPVLNASVFLVGLMAAAGLGFYWWQNAGLAKLEVNGTEIADPAALLVEARSQMVSAVEADGAAVTNDQRCYFAPTDRDQPEILCGPIWLGVSPADEPWLEVQTTFFVVDGTATGEVRSVVGTAAGEPRTFVRPDGLEPATIGAPRFPTDGIRLQRGERIEDPAVVLSETEALMKERYGAEVGVGSTSGYGEDALSLADGWRCFFLQEPDQLNGFSVVANDLWCGPGRSTTSNADRTWVRVRASYDQGQTFGSRAFRDATISIFRIEAVPDGATLFRPDGVEPADDSTVGRPPVDAGFADLVDYVIQIESDLTGSIATERDRIDFAALARTKQAGSGSRSFTAPPDHDLVVASIAPNERRPAIRGVLSVDGSQLPLPRWPSLDEGATLVLVVPEGAESVDLIIENDGRPQTLSLLDGTLAPGFPLALYRPLLEPGTTFSSRIEMPEGEATLISAEIAETEWSARDEEDIWLPEGLADLLVVVDDWTVDWPCCETRIENVEASFVLATTVETPPAGEAPIPDPDPEAEDPPSSTSEPDAEEQTEETYNDRREDPLETPRRSRPLRFRVPEELDEAMLKVEITVTFTHDDEVKTTSQALEVDLDLQ